MKISYNWLKEYIKVDLDINTVAAVLTDIGLEVEGIEEYESIKGGLEGLVIGEVVKVEHHTNADRLKVTKVNTGNSKELQIVCGASNVAEGQKVVVAKVGTTIHPIKGEPFTIKKASLRGVDSEGMLCAEDEIGISDNHDGIMVLPEKYKKGSLLTEYFPIEKDTIIEIGLTPNRSDAMSHLGVARDLVAALKIKKELNVKLNWPSIDEFKTDSKDLLIDVKVENPEACPRYAGVTISGVEVGESPIWLKNRLKAIGASSINNVVDVTNFVLHEIGQPLHAFDADEVIGKKVIVKTLAKGTEFITLDDEKIKLDADDLMICNEKEGMCIAGVFGGIKSGIKPTTKNIFLESAFFDSGYIRKTAKRHNLRTEAAMRFEKKIDPEKVLYALKRAALLIKVVAGGKISSEIIDIYPNKTEPPRVKLQYQYLTDLLGVTFKKELIKKTLEALEIKIEKETDDYLEIVIPTYKSDVTRPADVAEEILRIIGFDKIPTQSDIKYSLNTSIEGEKDHLAYNRAADYLSANGFNEIMMLSLSHSQYESKEEVVKLLNFSSSELDVLRTNTLNSGLEVIAHNLNRKNNNLKIFEFGKVYLKAGKKFEEYRKLSLFITGDITESNWNNKNKKIDEFYLKAFANNILKMSGIDEPEQKVFSDHIFTNGLLLSSNGKELAKMGMVQKDILKYFDIKQDVCYADINWDNILEYEKKEISYKEISKFPLVSRDLALVLDKKVQYVEIEQIAKKMGGSILKSVGLFDVYEDEKLGKDKKSYAVNFVFQDEEKTLTDQEIDDIMKKLMSTYEQKLGAVVRK